MQKQIQSFRCSASMSQEMCGIIFTFTDGTTKELHAVPPARFAAMMAVLQASPAAYYVEDDQGNYVSSDLDVPGN